MAQTKSTEQREVEQFATYIQKKGVNTRNKNAVIKAVDSFVSAESPFTSTAELKSRVSKLYDSGAFGSFENQSGLPSDNTRGVVFGAMDYDSAVAALGTFPKDRVPRLKDLMEKDTSKPKTQTAKPNGKVDLLHELTITNKAIAEGKLKPGFAKALKTADKVAAGIPFVGNNLGNKSPNVKELSSGGMEQKNIEIKAVAGSIAEPGVKGNPTTAGQTAKEFVSEVLNGGITNSIVKSILESSQHKKAFESILQQTLPNDVAKAREIIEKYLSNQPLKEKDQSMIAPAPEPTKEPESESKFVPKPNPTIKAAPEPEGQSIVPKPEPTIKAAPDETVHYVWTTKNSILKEKIPDSIIEMYYTKPEYRKVFRDITGTSLPNDKEGIRSNMEKYLRDHPEVGAKIIADIGPKLVEKTEGAIFTDIPTMPDIPTGVQSFNQDGSLQDAIVNRKGIIEERMYLFDPKAFGLTGANATVGVYNYANTEKGGDRKVAFDWYAKNVSKDGLTNEESEIVHGVKINHPLYIAEIEQSDGSIAFKIGLDSPIVSLSTGLGYSKNTSMISQTTEFTIKTKKNTGTTFYADTRISPEMLLLVLACIAIAFVPEITPVIIPVARKAFGWA